MASDGMHTPQTDQSGRTSLCATERDALRALASAIVRADTVLDTNFGEASRLLESARPLADQILSTRAPTPPEESGRNGGIATRERHGRDHYARAGKRGGESTLAQRGREHYQVMGKKGGHARARALQQSNNEGAGQ